MMGFDDETLGLAYMRRISSVSHDNHGLTTGETGVKRKRGNDDDIPEVSMRGGGAGPRAATGANAVVPTWIERL